MEQICDLSIIFTSPPEDSPPGVIASIEVRCETLKLNHAGNLFNDPLTQEERKDLLWYLEEYWKWPYEQFLERGKRIEALLHEVGKRLFKATLGNLGVQNVVRSWWLYPETQHHQITIVSSLPDVLSLPWELLADKHGFLTVGTTTRPPISIIRCLSQNNLSVFSASFELPLRVLLVTARPEDVGFVDPRGIARKLVEEMHEQVDAGNVELEFLRPPTLIALRTRLKDATRPIHILHFDGHGAFDERNNQQGVLYFEQEGGLSDPIKAGDLAQELRNKGVRLVVLTACQSAVSGKQDAFSSVAAQLIQVPMGADAVVAMGASILVVSAARYVGAFYRALAAGTSVQMAHERAQHDLYYHQIRHPHRRRLDEVEMPVKMQDWWIPHFYQQRPQLLQPTTFTGQRKKQQDSSPFPHLSKELPTEPFYGFVGRARELLQIERALMWQRLVVLHGFGGVGKTALARETGDWLIQTKMYDGVCFVSFEHGGDATMLLREIGNYLQINESNYNLSNLIEALEQLALLFKKRRILVIADNVESILPGGNAPLKTEVLVDLYDILLELKKIGAGVLLTSRGTVFGDNRLTSSNHVLHLALGGLHPEDAYALANRVLAKLDVDYARVPYPELRDLLIQLDHHPLAISLVLPALNEHPIMTIKTEFALLLSQFTDNISPGRNSSLLASLDYSLHQLDLEQRTLLTRLNPFEGEAFEEDLLEITQIPATTWSILREALVRTGLLSVEQVVHNNVLSSFLRFHPVLVPFLRSQSNPDNVALYKRYTDRYYILALYFKLEDKHNVRMRTLMRLELPNLRRARALLLEAGELESASEMTGWIGDFLEIFGLWRERDELRQQMGNALAQKANQGHEGLLRAEYLHTSSIHEDELKKGNVHLAYAHIMTLLERIEEAPEGTMLGRGSYDHCSLLLELSYCLNEDGRYTEAEAKLYEALDFILILIEKKPDQIEHQSLTHLFGGVLLELGNTLAYQGDYPEARVKYEGVLKIAKSQHDLHHQVLTLVQLGQLALNQEDYAEAQSHYETALHTCPILRDQRVEAGIWHRLGEVAVRKKEWTKAEKCYRESLVLAELLGDTRVIAGNFNGLATVSHKDGRFNEAEAWYKRLLEFVERGQFGHYQHAAVFGNLAMLLADGVKAGSIPKTRLHEARSYAEQALALEEMSEASNRIWDDFILLAEIADLEGRGEAARDYRHRARWTYVAFEGNRHIIDEQAGPLIAAIADSVRGDSEARARVELALPRLEAKGIYMTSSIQQIWVGERDWHRLVEDLDPKSALIVLRILETIALPT